MTYPDPQNPRQTPPTRAYSQDPSYSTGGYQTGGYQDPGRPYQGQQPAAPQPAKPSRGPDIDPMMYSGGVVMTGVVTGLAAWLVAWIISSISNKVTETGRLGIWNPFEQGGEYWFAVIGFLAALVGGALWYVLQLVTPTPSSFYRWIVGLLIVAAFVVPLLADGDIWRGLATAFLHLCIGLPILSLIPTMGNRSKRSK